MKSLRCRLPPTKYRDSHAHRRSAALDPLSNRPMSVLVSERQGSSLNLVFISGILSPRKMPRAWRAGRDGKASIVVLFHDRSNARRDIGLLQFMADRAVGSARLSAAEALATSSHKTAQIDRMASLTASQGCFRQSLVGYFTGAKRAARRSFSTWLLELVFADREVRQQKVICCDAC